MASLRPEAVPSMPVEPAMHFIFDTAPGTPSLRRWHSSHDYEVWTDCRPAGDAPFTLWEAHRGGALRVPEKDSLLHVIRGGVPHHVAGLFGYWRACDSDIVWLRTRQGPNVHYAMILGGCAADHKKDALLWICPRCAHTIGRHEEATGRSGLDRFWRREAEWVAAFNADVALRTCPHCKSVHPPAYRFRAGDDAPAGGDFW